jgi:putative transposase
MMKKKPRRHLRRSIRLKGYDYTLSGAYFVTICIQGGECLLGDVVEDEIRANLAGLMVQESWHALTNRFSGVDIDAFVVMPNHVHGVIILYGDHDVSKNPSVSQEMTGTRAAPAVGDVVGAYKSITTIEYIRGVRERGWPAFEGRFWQRNYWERIIRNEREFEAIRRYIWNNPASWKKDRLNPSHLRKWR